MEQTTDSAAPLEGAQASLLRSLRATIVVALLLLVLDSYIMGQGFVSMVVTFFSTLTFLVLAVAAFFKKRPAQLKKRLSQILVFWVMQAGVMGFNRYNAGLAEQRSVQLVKACRDYKLKHGNYPNSLKDLVPEFMAEIPKAKYGLDGRDSSFSYLADTHQIYWVVMPPFGRKFVDVESGTESFLD